uniref:Secreted protein n=1 Tax=Oryza brachyantha TaxID=4533 RepID=J3LPF4_ORYBR
HLLLVVRLVVATILHGAFSATVYDVLEQNNLPRGLIPQGVTSYVLHPDGHLQVTLPGDCNFVVTVAGAQYKFRFGSTFVGLVKPGSISEVNGVRVQVKWALEGISQVDRCMV